jgi:hypothetical protein
VIHTLTHAISASRDNTMSVLLTRTLTPQQRKTRYDGVKRHSVSTAKDRLVVMIGHLHFVYDLFALFATASRMDL